MVFLNEPEAGGDTHFPQASIRITPKRGALIAWNNLTEAGEPNLSSLHEGCPVEAGMKYIVTQWYREHPCRIPGFRASLRRVIGRCYSKIRVAHRLR
jgi:prolyl 4-hydroxylase